VLASWRQLLDESSLGVDEPHLAGTARAPEVRVNAATAGRLGLTEGEPAVVATEHGAVSFPVRLADLPDDVVWLPAHAPGARVRVALGAGHGDLVTVTPGMVQAESVITGTGSAHGGPATATPGGSS
jgi:NADH-quinone oxidoreductase subunit G